MVLDPLDVFGGTLARQSSALPSLGDKVGAAVDIRREGVLVILVAGVAETFLGGVYLRGRGSLKQRALAAAATGGTQDAADFKGLGTMVSAEVSLAPLATSP